jgi:FtsH-binding integral membrane protein
MVNQSPEGPDSRSTRDFLRIASASTALAFGCVAASMASLRGSAAGYSFEITVWTFVAFAVGALVAWWYWRLVAKNPRAARRASWLLALAGVGLFLYPLRYAQSDKLLEVAEGLGLAFCALAIVGWLLWRVKRFLDKDAERER